MNRNSATLLAQNPQVLKRLAKYMAQQCFRNTVLEDFHAGITPYSEVGDYSDVSVRTPAGEIPWSKLSRLSDEEMKTFMTDVVNRTYLLLRTLFDEDVGSYLIRTTNKTWYPIGMILSERSQRRHDVRRLTLTLKCSIQRCCARPF